MSEHIIKMPDVGEGVVEAEIVTWHVQVGDSVEEDQDVVDVMTDKATVEIPSPVSGKVVRLNGAEGEMIAVGSEILVIETDANVAAATTDDTETSSEEPKKGETKSPGKALHSDVKEKAESPPTQQLLRSDTLQHRKPLASPAVRQRAIELDVDLSDVAGSGPAGRILRSDLDDYVAAGGRAIARSPLSGDVSKPRRDGQTEKQVIGLRRKIARNMEAAWKTPLITYVAEIDVTELENLRQHLNAKRQAEQPKLTLIPFLATALIQALRDIPKANAHYFPEEDRLIEFDGVHLGVATATEKGLVVPVLHHAEAMDIWEIASNLSRLSASARDGKASREELSGSTITITSLGAMGGLVTTPILNPPETSIIGVNKIVERAVFDGSGRVVPRKFMNLSSSFDHRIVDGYDAAMLIQKVRERLEHPATLFM